jgi:hypothetical protein
MAENEVVTNFRFTAEDDMGGVPTGIADALRGVGDVANSVNGLLQKVSGPAGALAAGVGSFEIVSKALDVAKKADEAVARLRAATGGSNSAIQQVKELADTLAKSSTFSRENVLTVAADLLNRGVPQSQLRQALKASADLAAALDQSLDEAGKSLAATFGGVVPRDLGRAVPQLKELTSQALELGGAVSLVLDRFGGQAEAQTQTPFGKAQQEANAIQDEYRQLGEQLVKLEDQVLPVAVRLLTTFNQELASPAGQKFLSFLGNVLTNALRLAPALTAIAFASRALGPIAGLFSGIAGSAGKAAEQAERTAAAFSKGLTTGVGALAGGYLGFTATGDLTGARLGGALGGIAGASGLGGIAAAAAAADALYILASRTLGVNQDFDSFDKQVKLATDSLNNLASGTSKPGEVGDEIAFGAQGLLNKYILGRFGLSVDAFDDPQAEAVKRQIAAGNAAATPPDQLIAQHDAAMLARREELDKEWQKLQKDGEAQSQEEIEKSAEESNRRRLALGIESLSEYLQKEYDLTAAGIDREKNAKLQEIHDLEEQELRAYASGDQITGQQKQEQRNALQSEYNDLLEKSRDLQRSQAEEALRLADRQAELAKRNLEHSLGDQQTLISSGAVTPERGRAAIADALNSYKRQIEDIEAVLGKLAQQEGDVGDAARAALADLNAEAAAVETKTARALDDVRSISRASHDAALSLQQSSQRGIEDYLLAIETRSESAGKAFRQMVTGILEDILKLSNARIAEIIVGGGSGGSAGGGLFGLLGNVLMGNLGGAQTQVSDTAAAGGAGGWVGTLLGALVRGIAGGGFAAGGYTGPGSGIAGVVHGGEVVVPSHALAGGPGAVTEFINRSMPGFSAPKPSRGAGIWGSTAAGAGVATILPVAIVNENLGRQIAAHPSSPRIQADLMKNNPETFAPIIKQLSR